MKAMRRVVHIDRAMRHAVDILVDQQERPGHYGHESKANQPHIVLALLAASEAYGGTMLAPEDES